MGGWVAGLIFRALPALTGLTVPAANYVAFFQLVATLAIGARILLEDFAARGYPHRMDLLAPDVLDSPPRSQVIVAQVFRYFFYVFIASAFMGFGPVVWAAAALFMAPTLLEAVRHKLPNNSFIWRWLPVGLPGLAMILGLEIILENSLGGLLGDHPNFSTIFIFCLLGLLFFINLLGSVGREGRPGEVRLFNQSRYRWLARLGGLVTFLALIQFTSML